MKKIFSFIAAILCAASMMAAEPYGGLLRIPDGFSAKVTRGDVELQDGDSVFAGETLTIAYAVDLPYFLVSDSVVSVTLAADMFFGTDPAYYPVERPTIDRYYTVVLPTPVHATVTATLNDSAFTGGYALLGDTLVLNYVSTDALHWFFTDNNATSLSDTIVLDGAYFDANGVSTLSAPDMVEKEVYYLHINKYEYVEYFVTLNGEPIENDTIVHIGDQVRFCGKTTYPGWHLECYDTLCCNLHTFAPYSFDEDSTYIVNIGAEMDEPDSLRFKRIDATSTLITWKGNAATNYEIRVATTEPQGDFRYWKGVHTVQGTEFLAENLMPDSMYYVYIRAVQNDSIHSSWIVERFYANKSMECELAIEMYGYGDAWYGNAIIITENGKSTSFTIPEGKSDITEYYQTSGDEITITWQKGACYAGIGFAIFNENGDTICMADEFEYDVLTNGQILYQGYPCQGNKYYPRIKNITYNVDETGTQYFINWTAENAKTYEIVVTQDPNISAEQLEEQAISRKTRAYGFESEKPFAFYCVYVRGVREDGVKSSWRKQFIYLRDNNTKMGEELFKPIELDYAEKGTLLENAIACHVLGNDVALLGYSFEVTDTTILSVHYANKTPFADFEVICTRMDSINQILFWTDDSYNTDSVMPGKYALIIKNEIYDLTGYQLDIQLGKEIVDSIAYKEITLDYADTTDFVNAPNLSMPIMSGVVMPGYAYTFVPEDTVEVMVELSSASPAVMMAVTEGYREKIFDVCSVGQLLVDKFIKDTTYHFYVLNSAILLSGDSTVSYTLTVKAYKDSVIAPIHISADTIIENKFTADTYSKKDSACVHNYEFEVTNWTLANVFIEEIPSEQESLVMMAPTPTTYIIHRDSLTNTSVYRTDSTNNVYYQTVMFETENPGDTTHYFVTILGRPGAQYRFVIRPMANYDSIGGPLVQVGEHYTGTIDKYDYLVNHSSSNQGEGIRVPLEKDKNYVAVVYSENPDGDDKFIGISVMQPGVKKGEYDKNVLAEESFSNDDEWRAFRFTADTTAEYQFLIDANLQYKKDAEPLSYEFYVYEYMEWADYIAQLDTVEAPFYEQGKMLRKDAKVLYCDSAQFKNGYGNYITDIAGVWNTVGHAVNVPAGDTLMVEFISDEDLRMYIYGPNYFEDVDNDPDGYAYEAENTMIVNDDSVAHTYFVLGTFYSYYTLHTEHNYTLRFGLGEKSMEQKKVTAKISSSSVTVKRSAGIADIQAELLKLTIEAYDEQNNLIAALDNCLNWWTINDAVDTAIFELSDTDLPLGYTFGEDQQTISINIYRKKPATVTAKASADTITVAADATEAIIRAELAKLTLKVYTGSDKVVMNVTNNAQLWKINEEDNVATYDVKNDELPNLDDYTFSNGSGRITVYIKRQKDQGIDEVLANSDKAEKVLIDGQIYIIRDGKLYTIMGQLVR